MNHRSRSGDRLRHLGAAKSVERFNSEMFAQSEDCLFRQKRVTVVLKRAIDFADTLCCFVWGDFLRAVFEDAVEASACSRRRDEAKRRCIACRCAACRIHAAQAYIAS